MPFAELEIGLSRRGEARYAVDLRYSQPDSDSDIRISRAEPAIAVLDIEALQGAAHDAEAYGRMLGEQLFSDTQLQQDFAKIRVASESLSVPLRIRLFIDPGAAELHTIRWEMLRDPQDGALLFVGERVIFSRYLSSADWRVVQPRRRGELRALVIIANPQDVASYSPGGQALAPVDVAGELARATASLGDIPIVALSEAGAATLPAIAEKLREGYDIVYLVAHGALLKGEPRLWLENAEGKSAVTSGEDLINEISQLERRPTLVVLASCQSAGTGADNGALAALGPRLAEVGIPAVVAMQGSVTMDTIATFMPRFFKELLGDGQVDRAMALARGEVRTRDDFWMPVLFMRLKSGRVWYTPGFGDDGSSFEKWPAIIRSIRNGRCTPVIGAFISEGLLGSSREMARAWAERYRFPLAPSGRDDLPQVAQYLSVEQVPQFPREELLEYLRGEILRRYSDKLAPDLSNAPLDELFSALGELRRAADPADPYKVLAELPFPLYVTTNASNLLTAALRAANKDPQVEICRWHPDLEQLPSIYDDEPDYVPSAERPLVYHLYGLIQEPDSLVVTEDDYFDYLIGVTANKDLIPIVVRQALADSALLFLGFRLDDWAFRVLFRSIMKQEGGSRRVKHPHVGAQILPEDGQVLEPERARRYLEDYFSGREISVFWGSVEDLTRELQTRWTTEPERPARRW